MVTCTDHLPLGKSIYDPVLAFGPTLAEVPLSVPTTADVSATLVAQEVFVPSDCNILPLFPDWEGKSAFKEALAVVCPVPPLAIGKVPVTLDVKETLVIVLELPLIVLLVSVSVPASDAKVALEEGNVIVVASVPARVMELLAVSVFPSAMVSVAEVVGAVMVTLFMLVAVAAPMVGVVRVGLVDITTFPVPVIVLDTMFLLASVNSACEAVAVDRTGAEENVLAPAIV